MADATPALYSDDATPASRRADRALAVYEALSDELDDLDGHAKARATVAGYLSDWEQFRKWAADHDLAELPPAIDGRVALAEPVLPAEVRAYIADRQHDLKSATITRHLAAIRHWHHEAMLHSPTDHPRVKQALAGVTRKHRYTPRQAGPIRLLELQSALADLDDGPKGLRDRALLTFGWWAALRRSELVAIRVEHLRYRDGGAVLTVPHSKTDQTGAGAPVPVNHQHADTCSKAKGCAGHLPCPVCTLREWVAAAGIGSGPVFRRIDRHGNVAADPISPQVVSLVLKDAVDAAGLNAATYSAHSLRSGFVSSMDDHGVPRAAIRAVTRHKTEATMDLYGRPDRLLRDGAGAYLAR